MNIGDNGRVGQKDREFEELLCLAYLLTHSNSAEGKDESENPLADNVEGLPKLRGGE